MNGEQIRGLPVIGVTDARELGTVAHAYLDPATRRVVAFAILAPDGAPEPPPGALDSSGATFDAPRALAYLPIAAVRAFGQDALTVASAAALLDERPSVGESTLIALDALDGRDVVAEGGAAVGRVAAVAFDPATHAVTGIDVARGMIRGRSRIPASLILDLAADPVLVRDAADPALIRPARAPARPADATTADLAPDQIEADEPEPLAEDQGRSVKASRPPRSERRRKAKRKR